MEPQLEKDKTKPTTTIGVSVSFSPGEEQPTEAQPIAIPEDTKQETEATKTDAQEKDERAEEAVPADTPKPTEEIDYPTPFDVPDQSPNMLMWLLPLVLVAAIIVAILLFNLYKAKKEASKLCSRLNTQQKTPGTLIAKLNGQTHTLGHEDRIGTIYVGSGPNNTIKIPDKSISDRHVKIFKKRNDLMLQNIGKTPITINSTAIKPNAKQRLITPSVIEFNNKNRLNLSVIRPKPVTDKDSNNGTTNQNTK